MDRVFEYKVTPEYDGANIITVLKQRYKMSSSLIKALRGSGRGICLNGAHARTVDCVKTDDILKITLHESASENIIPVNIPLDIVYEDEDILVINKPPHTPTHPSPGNYDNTAANGVMYHFKSRGEERVFRAVNRLDKDTSGLMTIAKNAYIHARLTEEMRIGELSRRYMCIVCGDIARDGTVDAPIKRADGSVINRVVSEDGRRAVTHYRVLERFGKYTLLEMRLETGRTHQIRVHCAHIGHPLAGDWLYGKENKELIPRHALHSCFLRLIHPVTGETLEFNASLPRDMLEFISNIRQSAAPDCK